MRRRGRCGAAQVVGKRFARLRLSRALAAFSRAAQRQPPRREAARCHVSASPHFAIGARRRRPQMLTSEAEADRCSEWSVQEVGAWLERRGLGQHVQLFAHQKVDGGVLLALTDDQMREVHPSHAHATKPRRGRPPPTTHPPTARVRQIGISTIGDRMSLSAEAMKLKSKAAVVKGTHRTLWEALEPEFQAGPGDWLLQNLMCLPCTREFRARSSRRNRRLPHMRPARRAQSAGTSSQTRTSSSPPSPTAAASATSAATARTRGTSTWRASSA